MQLNLQDILPFLVNRIRSWKQELIKELFSNPDFCGIGGDNSKITLFVKTDDCTSWIMELLFPITVINAPTYIKGAIDLSQISASFIDYSKLKEIGFFDDIVTYLESQKIEYKYKVGCNRLIIYSNDRYSIWKHLINEMNIFEINPIPHLG